MHDSFSFKQFTVWHDRCAMKVGTDGVLIGAWAPVEHARRILDVGCGSALIALMVAQRSGAAVTAIDIDAAAAEQAALNVARSPWAARIGVLHADVNDFVAAERFDCIVSNPPYFDRALLSPDQRRSTARHTGALGFAQLTRCVARLLSDDGVFAVIVPADAVAHLVACAVDAKLYPTRKVWVRNSATAVPKRCMLTFAFALPERVDESTLVLRTAEGGYSDDYVKLTADFYLAL